MIPNMSPVKNLKPSEISEEEKRLADEIKRMLTDREYHETYKKASAARAEDFSNAGYVERIRKWIGK